jgi:hypothetical protein
MGYWYKSFVEIDGQVYYGAAKHFGWEVVDLGLPSGTLWSNVNVGSAWPEDYGKYYAWGEVSEKDTYTRDNYQYYDNGSYMTIGSNGNIASTNYDVAYLTMGNAWRMPTVDELRELNNNCTWTWVLVNGIKGYRVTGPNGNSIFLPATGFRIDDELLCPGLGIYWSGSLHTDFPERGWSFHFEGENCHVCGTYERNRGQVVRAVCCRQ